MSLPDRLWTLMEIGVGGYILGRTAEKMRERLAGFKWKWWAEPTLPGLSYFLPRKEDAE